MQTNHNIDKRNCRQIITLILIRKTSDKSYKSGWDAVQRETVQRSMPDPIQHTSQCANAP